MAKVPGVSSAKVEYDNKKAVVIASPMVARKVLVKLSLKLAIRLEWRFQSDMYSSYWTPLCKRYALSTVKGRAQVMIYGEMDMYVNRCD